MTGFKVNASHPACMSNHQAEVISRRVRFYEQGKVLYDPRPGFPRLSVRNVPTGGGNGLRGSPDSTQHESLLYSIEGIVSLQVKLV